MSDRTLVRSVPTALTVQMHAMHALMLRDMRTRFGGSHWGYLIAVGWPCGHILLLVAILTLRGLKAPLGDSTVLFVATGTTPYITFMYMSRKIMEGVSTNKPLTYFPVVTFLDLITSRAIIEVLTAFATTGCVMFMLTLVRVNPLPVYPSEAIFAMLATILFAIGMGIVNANIAVYFPGWFMGYVFVVVAGYSVSGLFFLPDLMPKSIFEALSWNPMLQCIMWFRSAFYPGYGTSVAKLYTVSCGLGLVVVGLALERFVTRQRLTTL